MRHIYPGCYQHRPPLLTLGEDEMSLLAKVSPDEVGYTPHTQHDLRTSLLCGASYLRRGPIEDQLLQTTVEDHGQQGETLSD
ncbi:unnamed protein product [Lota lota]